VSANLGGKGVGGFGFGRRGAALLAIALLLALGLFAKKLREGAEARAAFPLEEGRIAVAGIAEPIEIYRDSRGIPHIQAANEVDAYFGWGFAHAQDRLAQMLWLLMSARGRTAEIAGTAGLEADRWARTLGWGALGDRQFEHLDERFKELLIAYAAGVNARLERIRDGRVAPPIALEGGKLPAELWQPSDSLAILKFYSWGLADTVDVSLVLRDITAYLGSRAARPFFPSNREDSASPFQGVLASGKALERSAVTPTAGLERLRRVLGVNGRAVGSSAWVLGGKHTESGYPILAADSHLETTAPPLLHVVHVRGAEFDVAGAAVPGVPVIWTGHNQRVAWASTSARLATIDLYRETLGESNPSRYHDGKSWRELEERLEVIGVRGRAEEELTVRSTGHGPLVDTLIAGETEPLSLAWVGAREDINSALASMSKLARARDASELRQALAEHHEPPLAVAYADRNGEGGVQVAAWIPVRALPTDLVPLPGRARWYDWQGRLDFEQLPAQQIRSGRGWVIAADNPIARNSSAEKIDWLWRSGVRAERVHALLESKSTLGKIDLRGMSELQSDVGSQVATSLVAMALEAAGPVEQLSVEAQEIAQLLDAWDGSSGPESVGAAAYHIFIERLASEVLGLVIGEELADRYRALPQVDDSKVVFALVRSAADNDPAAALDADNLQKIARKSLRETWLRLSFKLGANRGKWRWGRLHRLSFRPFGDSRNGSSFDGLSDLPYGGSGNTVNTAELVSPGDFSVRVASIFRMVVDAGSLDQALTAIAPGQSEHPRHPHFSDSLDDWLAGHSALLVTDRLLVRESGARQLVLEPLP
jgi:penicillin amidase